MEADPIPLLTPYKMGNFNLSHRYLLLYFQFQCYVYFTLHILFQYQCLPFLAN